MPNDTTPAPIGADAALALLVAAVEAETGPGWDCNSYHPSLWPALKAARAALASAAQPERVPLTDVQIDECLPLGVAGYSALIGDDEIRAFARAVEATHGIKPAKEDKP